MRHHGIFPALPASYGDDGNVSVVRQAALIDHVLEQGLDGVFISGSTGESLLQTIGERRATIAAAVDQVSGRGEVIAHTGSMDQRSTLELTEFAVALGVDAVCAITPIYFEYTEEDYLRFYREISRVAADTPVIAYHIPSRTHAALSSDFFVRLADEGTLQGVKYTCTDLYPLSEIVRRTPADFVVYNGADEVLLGGLALGASGGIGSTYNVIGQVYTRIRDAVANHDYAEARASQNVANSFIDSMNAYNFLAFLRELLRIQGIETGESRAPLPRLTPEQRDRLRAAVDSGEIAGLTPPQPHSQHP